MRNAAASSLASFVYVLVASGGTFIIRGEHGGVLSREPMNDGCPDVCNKSVEETKRVQPLKLIAAASRCTRACTHKSTTLIDVRLAPTSGAKDGVIGPACLRIAEN